MLDLAIHYSIPGLVMLTIVVLGTSADELQKYSGPGTAIGSVLFVLAWPLILAYAILKGIGRLRSGT